jgi:hypothetical protein
VSLVKIKGQRGENKGKHIATCLENYLKTKIVFFSIYRGWMECCAVTLTIVRKGEKVTDRNKLQNLCKSGILITLWSLRNNKSLIVNSVFECLEYWFRRIASTPLCFVYKYFNVIFTEIFCSESCL